MNEYSEKIFSALKNIKVFEKINPDNPILIEISFDRI